MQKLRRSLLSATLTLGFGVSLSFGAGHVLAHGTAMMTMPSDGQHVSTETRAMQMMFEAPMRVTRVTLAAPDGKTHRIDGPAATKPVKTWQGKLPKLEPGRYRVEWRGLSPDGHPMKGSFGFSVGQ